MELIRNTKLSTQFIVIALIALASMAVISSVNAITLKNSLLAERKTLIKSAIEITYAGILTEVARAEKNGEDIAVAQKNVIEQINGKQYAGKEYFFIVNTEGVVLVSPAARAIEGKNQFNAQDTNGKFFIRELIDNGSKVGGGFTDYYWNKFNSDVALQKLSYTKTYEPWGWIVGTGVYLDDIDALFYEKLVKSAAILIFAAFTMVVMVLLILRNNRKSMQVIFNQLTSLEDDHAVENTAHQLQIPDNELGSIMNAVVEARTKLIDQMEMRQQSETSRIRQVLDQASSPLLLANSDGLITYANRPAIEIFTLLKPILKQHCSDYRDEELTSLTLEQLHPDPRRFANELNTMSKSMQEQLRIGDRDLKVVTTRVVDDKTDGKNHGFVAEWIDVTEQLAHDREMDENACLEREKNETIRQRVDQVLKAVDAASLGDLRGNIVVTGDDAVGLMSNSLEKFLERLRDNLSVIGSHVTSISNATGSLFSTAEDLGNNAKSTSNQAATASASASNISDAIETVASSATQMNSSIQEIADNTNTAATVAQTAVELAGSTDQSMRKLAESSNKIGQVIKVITTIAEQTNLLALNATIEAARAGEAGKGFAVVAGEVKELAKETARATEDIGVIIKSIQSDTESAVNANTTIVDTVTQIYTIQTEIASAVEEQMRTTREITRSVQAAADGCGDVVNNVSLTATSAEEARTAAAQSSEAVEHLTSLARELDGLVTYYKVA